MIHTHALRGFIFDTLRVQEAREWEYVLFRLWLMMLCAYDAPRVYKTVLCADRTMLYESMLLRARITAVIQTYIGRAYLLAFFPPYFCSRNSGDEGVGKGGWGRRFVPLLSREARLTWLAYHTALLRRSIPCVC